MATDWQAFGYLLGEWEGGHEGDPGQGHGRFSFHFDLDQKILVRKNRTVFPPTAEREGYTHDDLLIIYTENDGTRRGIYFDNEQHVIHYEVSVSPDQATITMVSNPVATDPQFRFTYHKLSEHELDASFDMAPPGKPGQFFTYIAGKSRRLSPK